jgi:hypothetical protein
MECVGAPSDHREVFARLLTCAVLALALVPAAAGAQTAAPAVPVPAAQPLMDSAHALAVARWGMDPCGGQVAVSWSHMGSSVNARSQWMSVDTHDPTTFSECSITYNLDVDWNWPKLCTVIEHELGHLSGHSHVSDPHDVMSAYYVYPTSECSPLATGTAAATPAATTTSANPSASTRKASSKKKATAKKKTAKQKAAERARKARAAHRRKARLARAKAARARARKAAAHSRARFALA